MSNYFEDIWKSEIQYKSKVDLYENLYLQAIIDSYEHIDKSKGKEEKIRDRFYYDLTFRNPLTKKWVDLEILDISFEKWKIDEDKNKSRVDLSFFWSGFGHFEIECKRLFQQQSKNKAYLNEGLTRFIDMKYSKKNEYAGMIGFVVSGEIAIIKDNIFQEVSIYYPNKTLIRGDKLNWKYSFVSYHKKINKENIQIYHIFFQFSDL